MIKMLCKVSVLYSVIVVIITIEALALVTPDTVANLFLLTIALILTRVALVLAAVATILAFI